MYEIIFTKQANKTLRKMSRNRALLIRNKLESIATSPYAKHNNVTKLHNRPGYRLRVGDWHVIYDIQDGKLVILVLKIGSRGGLYR